MCKENTMNPNMNLNQKLQELLNKNEDKRVVVIGTTCTGKSTFLTSIKGAHDMDELIFPQLSKEEADYVNSSPWTEEIGRTMDRLAKERVKVKSGEPVFGTIIFDCDLLVNLKISDSLLRKRVESRGVSFNDAKRMQKQIDMQIKESRIPVVEFHIG